ncbi:Phospholipase/carboxylesterase/thioesterase [Cokeromyces recurvatus]|uniref:Phospholipase/carboxylesterase/thioesterase n=1 Tax=Cokeromyces recurvatus TaxID=90255 RepID=UPI0022210A71|nr:Phospholipase/carboxylesterase/thioesterase [Cokeromyces recurvatus]KAI7902766.1 Phospholipase/carboxylesterase/thioesterase [Cokeromyces recurvatus]
MVFPSIIVSAKTKQTATVLWLHGLGDTGAGWSFLAEELSSLFPYIKWIFPNAPIKPVTLNNGYPMPAWFDITGLDKSHLKQEDEKGMLDSVASMNQIIRDEVNSGIPSNRIIVGGFSQGCVLSLLTGLTSEYKLGAIIGCSGWLGLSSKFSSLASEANKNTPILMCHGDNDPVVLPQYGKESAELLQTLGYNVTRKTYPGLPHSANDTEIRDIAEFIKKHIPPTL